MTGIRGQDESLLDWAMVVGRKTKPGFFFVNSIQIWMLFQADRELNRQTLSYVDISGTTEPMDLCEYLLLRSLQPLFVRVKSLRIGRIL